MHLKKSTYQERAVLIKAENTWAASLMTLFFLRLSASAASCGRADGNQTGCRSEWCFQGTGLHSMQSTDLRLHCLQPPLRQRPMHVYRCTSMAARLWLHVYGCKFCSAAHWATRLCCPQPTNSKLALLP